jgi:hypothetical protein
MLRRSPLNTRSSGAARARASRARRAAGIRVLRIEVHERRLTAALRAAGRLNGDPELAGAIAQILEDFTERWLGKKPRV